jgi:ubiquinone biosynthesis protein UbiJ
MHTFKIYYENADTDDEKRYLGEIQASSMGEALHKASQWYEVPSYDLVAEQITPNRLFNPLRKDHER